MSKLDALLTQPMKSSKALVMFLVVISVLTIVDYALGATGVYTSFGSGYIASFVLGVSLMILGGMFLHRRAEDSHDLYYGAVFVSAGLLLTTLVVIVQFIKLLI